MYANKQKIIAVINFQIDEKQLGWNRTRYAVGEVGSALPLE